MKHFLEAFIPLFVAIDPVSLAVVFLAMAKDVEPAERRRIARQATWTGGAVALLFLGASVFAAVGITVSDFQIAGGVILFVLAGRDLVQSAVEEPALLKEDFGVVPLGMPLIAGPAAIATLLVLARSLGIVLTLAALAANLLVVVFAFTYSERLAQWIRPTGLRAISKIISLLLAAIAVHMIRQGWSG